MLTVKEKKAISIIVTDIASGRHLLRTKQQWDNFEKNYGVSIQEYDDMYQNIHKISQYSMISEGDLSVKEYEIFLFYKMCQDISFEEAIKNFALNELVF